MPCDKLTMLAACTMIAAAVCNGEGCRYAVAQQLAVGVLMAAIQKSREAVTALNTCLKLRQ